MAAAAAGGDGTSGYGARIFYGVGPMYAARRNAPLRCARRFIRPDPLSGGERRTRNIKTAC